jgi:hypothetical protein
VTSREDALEVGATEGMGWSRIELHVGGRATQNQPPEPSGTLSEPGFIPQRTLGHGY